MRLRRKGFSLMEVLAVTAIIGTLASLLFPVFAKAKGAAEKTSCISNLKELSLAAHIYAQDNDDRLFPFGYEQGPKYVTWWGELTNGDATGGLLYPYTKSGKIRACPSALDLPNQAFYFYTMGYGMNFRLFYGYAPEPFMSFRTVAMTQIERPTETLLGGDSANWSFDRKIPVGHPWLYGDGWSSHFQSRHAGGVANVQWIDGHVTAEHLYYHVAVQGVGQWTVDPKDLKASNLGDLLRYPREDPESSVNSIRDQFYYLIQKPAGL